ncbi:MarR family transcriptional regulator [Haladaptatus sp. F3-133]|jgi:DNA-binding MarR family transcriptional regulator|uniref:MarR family transcriptional regulator n=1 Tax=Halorutilus salinus TaxID=2487751 RepID=A0A9Q4GFD5_9EURY|nr:MarR family transcriptional regulator [Halorutilus salinus]MCX2818044.1 MarR family transcriptional regulator [Halorutilus salinus]
MTPDLSENERDAVEYIRSAGDAYQSKLWKELDVTSRTGSRIAKRLEEKGVVKREQTTHDGNNTYRLVLAEEYRDDDAEEEEDEPATAGYELESVERRALRLIESEDGLPQSQLWKELDVSSRKGSRIASKLEDRGLVEREEGVHEGNRTYILYPVVEKLDYSLLVAGDMISPFIGEENPDPRSGSFTEWVYELAYSE